LTKPYHHHQDLGLGTDKLKLGEIAVQMKKVRSGHLVKAATEGNVQATFKFLLGNGFGRHSLHKIVSLHSNMQVHTLLLKNLKRARMLH
jgi:hypothetical protein